MPSESDRIVSCHIDRFCHHRECSHVSICDEWSCTLLSKHSGLIEFFELDKRSSGAVFESDRIFGFHIRMRCVAPYRNLEHDMSCSGYS